MVEARIPLRKLWGVPSEKDSLNRALNNCVEKMANAGVDSVALTGLKTLPVIVNVSKEDIAQTGNFTYGIIGESRM